MYKMVFDCIIFVTPLLNFSCDSKKSSFFMSKTHQKSYWHFGVIIGIQMHCDLHIPY